MGEHKLNPHLEMFGQVDRVLPVGKKNIHVLWDGSNVKVDEKTQS